MNIVEPYARLMSPIDRMYFADVEQDQRNFTRDDGVEMLRRIEWCGRISHRSEDKQTPDSWERFIKAVVLEHGDWSIVEHASVTVDFLVDRGITHEIVRHRLFSFTQESTRFVNYEKKMPPSFILPLGLDQYPPVASDPGMWVPSADNDWCKAIEACEVGYRQMLAKGCAPQIARSVFPNALASRLIVTGNLRNWRHFLIMRTTKEAHPQMRQVTIPLLVEFKAKIPILFDDIEPMAKQSEGMRKGR
jgi:thymidylate synthase (FAD)